MKHEIIVLKRNVIKTFRKNFVLTIITIFLTFITNASAQSPVDTTTPLVPSAEAFELADGLITLDTDGPRNIYSDTVRIYNEDGSLWYEFSLDETHPLYFKKNAKQEFQPYAPIDYFKIAIRLKAASPNWYEVIVDEKTQKTKYMWVGEFFLRRETFQKYVMRSAFVSFDKEKNALRETPDGRISSIQPSDTDRVSPFRIEGEWLLVRITRIPLVKKQEFGWIRWKQDRDILIEFFLNCRDCR